MAPVSTPARDVKARRWVWIAAAAAVAVAVLFVMFAESTSVHLDLQLVAGERVQPSVVPMRAFLFDESGALPELVAAPVEVEIASGDRVVARGRLDPTPAGDMAGSVDLTSVPHGSYALRASSEGAEVVRELEVAPEPARSERRPRAASPLQAFAEFPIRAVEGHTAPSSFEARVAGGACVPELECTLLVDLAPAHDLRIVESAAVEIVAPPRVRDGVWAASIRVRGADVELGLEALREGVVVAGRTVRLPLALGGFVFDVEGCTPPCRPEARFEGADRPVIVDAFRDAVWNKTATLAVAELDDARLPFELEEPGLWHLQARTDPFSTRNAFVRAIDLGERSERGRFDRALDELEPFELPRAVSGSERMHEELESRKSIVRIASVVLVLAAGALTVVFVARRGLAATAVARRIEGTKRRGIDLLVVLGAVLGLSLIFAGVAFWLLLKGL
jgi:hypothetical protein